MVSSILVLCIGNICRSPIGEAIFASRLSTASSMISVSSAGINALVNYPADLISQELMLERGLDISGHLARQLTSDMAFRADIIFTMDLEQQKYVEKKFPSLRGRTHRLGKWSGFDVPDPFQRPRIIFEQALALIEQGVDEWYRTLWV